MLSASTWTRRAGGSVALAAFVMAVAPTLPAYAKPKEIVVVGATIKEVIAEAGLRPGPGLEEAVSDAVYRALRKAIRRAAANRRARIAVFDLDALTCIGALPSGRAPIVLGDVVDRFLLKRGLVADAGVVPALSDQVYLLLADAVRRTLEQTRQVTLVQDL